MTNKRTARDIMRVPVFTAQEDMILTDVIKFMADKNVSGLPVVDHEGNYLGVLSWRMITNPAIMVEAPYKRVSDILNDNLDIYGPCCSLNMTVEQIMIRFSSNRINRMVVVDYSGVKRKVIGIICRQDIIREVDRTCGQLIKNKDKSMSCI